MRLPRFASAHSLLSLNSFLASPDVVTRATKKVFDVIASIPEEFLLLPLRLTAVLLLVGAVCWFSFHRGSCSLGLQPILVVVILLGVCVQFVRCWKKVLCGFGGKLKKALFPAFFLLILSCSPSSSPDDVLGIAVERAFEWINRFQMALYLLPVRLAVIFGLVTLSSAYTFLHIGARSPAWQIGLAIFAGLAGVTVPIHLFVPTHVWLKGWVFVVCVILTFVLPYTFPFFLTDKEGYQKWTFRGCLIFIALTLVATLIRL